MVNHLLIGISQVVDMTTSEPEVIRVGKGDPSMFQ
jgi:hypothetical protein